MKRESTTKTSSQILSPPLGERRKEFSAVSLLAARLSFLAGSVNSISLLGFNGFVSHISGHATHAAIEFSEGKNHVAITFVFATFSFIFGAICTTLLQSGQTLESRTKRFLMPLGIELAVLAGVWFALPTVTASQSQEGFSRIFINLLSFAMGLQNALVRQVSGGIVRTTHMTGIATDMGISIGDFLRHVARSKQVNSVSSFRESLRHFSRKSAFALHMMLFLSFFGGAMLGTVAFLKFSFDALFLPIAMNAIILAIELRIYFKRRTRIILA